MQGTLIVVVGIALMYLVLSGRIDCIIAAFRACSGGETETAKASNAALPSLNPTQVLDNVLTV